MKHFGDITKLSGYTLPIVDVITGGSPCQDLSVAGKRAGLAGERSGLFMEQMRIVKEMRERDRKSGRTAWMVRPRWLIWENVPGAFSSGNPKGSNFAAVIEEIIKVAEPGANVCVCVPNGGWTKSGCYYAEDGSWSIAWRVHDAQFWGVPQRRKRISLVADFGGLSAPEILFERKGLSGDFEPRREARQETAGAAGEGVEGAIGFNRERCGAVTMKDAMPTLQAAAGESGNNQPMVVTFGGKSGATSGVEGASGTISFQERGTNPEADTARTLDLNGGSPACNQGGIAVVQSVGCDVYNQEVTGEVAASLTAASGGTNTSGPKVFENHSQDSRYKPLGEVSETVSAKYGTGGNNQPLVVSDAVCVGNGQLNQMSMAEQANTPDTMHDQQAVMVAAVDCRHGKENTKVNGTLQEKEQGQNLNSNNVCRVGSVVRRLTPLECERLQGYPDGWTDIGEWVDSKGKKRKDADSPRYKALGNSIALPFWQWMARRICAQYERPVTMASLFDGIGGFPLVFSRCGATPVWASEIEEFPMAVTRVHFPEEET